MITISTMENIEQKKNKFSRQIAIILRTIQKMKKIKPYNLKLLNLKFSKTNLV